LKTAAPPENWRGIYNIVTNRVYWRKPRHSIGHARRLTDCKSWLTIACVASCVALQLVITGHDDLAGLALDLFILLFVHISG
jgi:hypothetical protein